MRKLSIRVKITIWFSILLILMVAFTYVVVLSVSKTFMDKSLKDTLIETVENNVDEIEFFSSMDMVEHDNDDDQYISYYSGFLEIDDDYLDRVNGVSTALYQSDGNMLYGENPIAKSLTDMQFNSSAVQKRLIAGTYWFIFDKELTAEGLDNLWLRGVISTEQETTKFSSIVHLSLILMPILLILAILGGYLIAARSLRPIKNMATAASTISHGSDLTKRIDIWDGGDEVHELACSFNEMLNRLNTSFTVEKQFTSDASHELRTPTSVILAQCDYTLDDERTVDEYKDALRVIRRQSGKMNRLIEDMLSFTRMECNIESVSMTDTDLSQLFMFVCKDMALIRDKDISLTYDITPNIHIYGNNQLLSRMLSNLIFNAYKYGNTNGFIKVSLTTSYDKSLLSVEDNGIGIPKEHIQQIFRRFYQIDSSRSGSGSGLGLSMVQEIVRIHNGRVWVDSIVNKGSTFYIELDLHK